MIEYSKWTKNQLIVYLCDLMADGEPLSAASVLDLSKLTKAELMRSIRLRLKAGRHVKVGPCPKGHQPGDPKCDALCFITNITPMPTPFVEKAPRVPASGIMHSWVQDELKPAAREPEMLYTARAWMKRYPEVLRRLSIEERKEFLEPLAKAYRELEAQFPKRPSRIVRCWTACVAWFDGIGEWLYLTRPRSGPDND